MPKTTKPDLTLVVRSKTNTRYTWTLNPEGRDSFRIVVVCVPENELQAQSITAFRFFPITQPVSARVSDNLRI